VKLSVLMPVFNEEATLQAVLERVVAVDYPCEMELVVVDDASTDATTKILDEFHHPRVIMRRHSVNRGKGAAIRTAAEVASGDFVIPCDADLEYRPEEIPLLLDPILADDAEVVFGNRTFGSHSAYSFWYVMGNRGITTVANVLFNSYIGDLETCYKLLPLKLYRELDIRSDGFGMEAEITAKLLSRGVRPYEVPISYRARGREDGKKITWWDGVEALWIMVRIRLRPPA
jgi:glycosyltransferase involved in cell wall biosynthesis